MRHIDETNAAHRPTGLLGALTLILILVGTGTTTAQQLGAREEGDPVQLGYRDSVVGFEFAALDFTPPERNQYRYRLEGLEDDWNDVGDARRVTYTNLSSGQYTLRVQTSNNDGLWNEDGLTMALVVGTPPWRAWWAIVLYVLCAAGVVLAIVRRQMNKLERQAEYSRRLEQEVATRTDELKSQNRELGALNQQLQAVSVTDSLTGLWNRRYLANEMPKDLALIRRARVESPAATRGASRLMASPPKQQSRIKRACLAGMSSETSLRSFMATSDDHDGFAFASILPSTGTK